MRRSGKTSAERLKYNPVGVWSKGDNFHGFSSVEHVEMTPGWLGETVVREYGKDDIKARLIAVREDIRFQGNTRELHARKVALIIEAHEAGWTRGEISRATWNTASNVTLILRKAGVLT